MSVSPLFSIWNGRLVAAALTAVLAAAGPVVAQTDDLAALIAAGGRALESGNLQEAEQAFRRAAEKAPERALPWLGLSEVSEQRGDWVEALRLARLAEERAPERPEIVFMVSRQLSRLGRVDEALAALERFRSLAPDRPEGYLLAASLLASSGREGKAIELLDAALGKVATEPRVPGDLALLLLSDGQVERAVAVAEEASRDYPESASVQAVLGLALAASPHRRAEAVEWLESGLAAGAPAPGQLHLELATLYDERGESERALEHLRRAGELMPESVEVQYKLGAALRNSGDIEGARAALTRYQELERARTNAAQEDRNLGTRFNEIQGLANENRLLEALEAADALLREHSAEDRVLALRGKVLFSLGRLSEALESVIAARRLVPSQVEYHFLEGMFLLQAGLPEAAAVALSRALALDPDLADAHALTGMALSSLERYAEAVVSFERALALGADSGALRLGYAEALRGTGRLEESRRQMDEYRKHSGG